MVSSKICFSQICLLEFSLQLSLGYFGSNSFFLQLKKNVQTLDRIIFLIFKANLIFFNSRERSFAFNYKKFIDLGFEFSSGPFKIKRFFLNFFTYFSFSLKTKQELFSFLTYLLN